MIPGDEGKPMNIMEYISDEPRDALPYLAYALENERGMLKHWRESSEVTADTARRYVCAAIDRSILHLEEAQRKLMRERREASGAPEKAEDS